MQKEDGHRERVRRTHPDGPDQLAALVSLEGSQRPVERKRDGRARVEPQGEDVLEAQLGLACLRPLKKVAQP